MATRRSQRNLPTPKKEGDDRAALDSDPERESDSENTSQLSHASGSLSYCSESPGSASFEVPQVRNRSRIGSPHGSVGFSDGDTSPISPRTRSSHASPLSYQKDGIYPDLSPFSTPSGPTKSPISSSARSPASGAGSPSFPKSPRTPKSPRSPRQRLESECQEYHINQTFIIIMAVILGLVVAGIYVYTTRQSQVEVSAPQPNVKQIIRDAFSLGSKKLTAAFPSQTSNFWATINAAVKSIMDPQLDALQPAVIMITCVKENCHLADCLAGRLADTVTEAYASEPYLNLNVTRELLSLRAEDAKLRVDDEIRSSFQTGSRVAILKNLHDLQGGAAMILHGFCDNENAPFKEAVLIFTLELDSKVSINTAIGLNNAIEATLTKSWGKALDADNINALFSRLVNSPVFVKSESVSVYQEQCKGYY